MVSSFLFAQKDLKECKYFGSNPGNLAMFMYAPAVLKDSCHKKPLIVALHGCSQNAEAIAKQSGWNMLSEKYGFYVLYPQQKFSNNPSECFDWFRKNDILKDKGEVCSIKNMIEFICDSLPVDTEHIFVYGLSAGAVMAVSIMADYPYMIKAGAILAGGPFNSEMNAVKGMTGMMAPPDKSPLEWSNMVRRQNVTYTGKYPEMIIYHGQNDPVVNFRNSKALIDQWTYLHKTDTIPDIIENSFQNNKYITKITYLQKDSVAAVIFYNIANLGHRLMVDPGTGETQGGSTGLFAVDKDFFSTYWILLDFGIIKK